MHFFSLERWGKNPSSLFFTGEILPKKIRNSKFKNDVIMGGFNSQKLGKAMQIMQDLDLVFSL